MKKRWSRVLAVYLVVCFVDTPFFALTGIRLTPFIDGFMLLLALWLIFDRSIGVHKQFGGAVTWLMFLIVIAAVQLLSYMRFGIGYTALDTMIKGRGVLLFLLNVYVFIGFYSQMNAEKLKQADRLIESLIKANLVVLLVEGIAINLYPLQSKLAALFHDVYIIQPYTFIFPVMPNGLVLGPQHGGFLALAGIIKFTPWVKGTKLTFRKVVWLLLSVFAFLLTLTGASIIGLSGVMITSTLVPWSRTHKLVWRVVVFACLVCILGSLTIYVKQLMTMKFGADKNIDKYYEAYKEQFLDPVNALMEHPREGLLGGDPREGVQAAEGGLVIEPIHADFGLGYMAVRFGMLLTAGLLLGFTGYTRSMIKRLKSLGDLKRIEIVAHSLLITVCFSVSLIHYNTFFKSGVAQMNAALIALSLSLACGRTRWGYTAETAVGDPMQRYKRRARGYEMSA